MFRMHMACGKPSVGVSGYNSNFSEAPTGLPPSKVLLPPLTDRTPALQHSDVPCSPHPLPLPPPSPSLLPWLELGFSDSRCPGAASSPARPVSWC